MKSGSVEAAEPVAVAKAATGSQSGNKNSAGGAPRVPTTPISPTATANLKAPLTVQAVPSPTAVVLGKDVPFLVKMESQKQWYQEPALYFSTLAILFSIFSLWVNLRVGFTKDQRARRQSIEDEFFLRKVLYPLAIEPALEHYAKMLSSLPPDRFDPSATAQAIDDFKKEFEKENSAIVAKMVTLGILGQALLDAIRLELEAIEDLVSEYCFENSSGYDPAASTNTNTRSSVESQVAGRLVTMLKAIKAFQESVK